ncbi:DEAD/DEAH box helicase [Acidithiobacillus sp. MC6.1]|nr:DEAD/DEAH box helicase [Acidithiobacillus sp. MC6.1]
MSSVSNPSATLSSLSTIDQDALKVARAIALLWSWHPMSMIHRVLQKWGIKNAAGKAFTYTNSREGLESLQQAGLLREQPNRAGYYQLLDTERSVLYEEIMEKERIETLQKALYETVDYNSPKSRYSWPFWEEPDTVSVLRFLVFTDTPDRELDRIRNLIDVRHFWDSCFEEACLTGVNEIMLARVTPAWRWKITATALLLLAQQCRTDLLPFLDLAQLQFLAKPANFPESLRIHLGEVLLHRGEPAQMEEILSPVNNPAADAIRAGSLVQRGEWAAAQKLFENALKAQRQITKQRNKIFPPSLIWLYPYALLAQGTPAHLDQALKFVLGESGSRDPDCYDAWGIWVHAIRVRLGEQLLDIHPFVATNWPGSPLLHLHRALLQAWLAPEMQPHQPALRRKDLNDIHAETHAAFKACGFDWFDAQLTAAEQVSAGQNPGVPFFVEDGKNLWRQILNSLQTLTAEVPTVKETQETRRLWSLQILKGRLFTIEALEQRHGVRGWGKAKIVPFSRIVQEEHLSPEDARVVQAIYQDRQFGRVFRIDRAAALQALIGHPAVVFGDDTETLVDVVAGQPEIQVRRRKDHYEILLDPPLETAIVPPETAALTVEEKREQEVLGRTILVRDSQQRLRVIFLTDAQRRAAHILAQPLKLPFEAETELQATLAVLANHFHIQSDQARPSRELAADPRLRAELAPAGDGLLLRLVVAPLGPEGPRFMPGRGYTQVMAPVQGETLGAQRDLKAEKGHLNAILDVFPFLSPPSASDRICEWSIEDPEEALTLVEQLPQQAAIGALDWPKGQPIRVQTITRTQLRVTVQSRQDWFSLEGEITVDEERILRLQELLEAANQGSRFLPMGNGLYAALTRELRERLQDLALVAEASKNGYHRVPALAAGWLKEVLEGAAVKADAGFHARLEHLDRVQNQVVRLPDGLQVTLRPYQEDGVIWMLRLAAAGFGACLADDMGLGKTLQAIAVLLTRASGGPALVVAPTSLCGNWASEISRFAPSLQPIIYGAEADRAASLEGAQSGDVLLVSYALLQQAQERFAQRVWHTLVVDEAQAIKNATAKRSLALFDLQGDFRLALSGTPVENHLTELWSIFHFCNPGLLGTQAQFSKRFALPIERDQDRDAQRRLRRLITPFLLRRTKAQVLQDLPECTEVTLTLTPDKTEAAHYEALRRKALLEAEAALEQGETQASFHILTQLTRLRRAACDPRLVSPELGFVGAKVRAFAEMAVELVENGHKALVFSQFVDFLTLLRAPLDASGLAYQYLDGSTPAAERDRRVAAFQAGEGHLFLISLKAGGFGLNLTAADYVIIADPWWNPAVEDQATGRAHRMGQNRPVTVYRLVTQGTLEEKIIALHRDKRALADGVLAEADAGGTLPSAKELITLMRENM